MTATKFVLQARALGLTVTGYNPMIRITEFDIVGLSRGKILSSWSTVPGQNSKKRRNRQHRSIIDAVKSFEKRYSARVITDPIIRAAHGMEP